MSANVENTMTTPEAWRAWKLACAVDLCDAESAALLRRFGSVRFAGYVRRSGLTAPDIRDPWHLLESHCQVAKTRAGKRYKDWLFIRADAMGGAWAAAVECGASILMRAVVRDFLRHECSPSFMTSMQTPFGGGVATLEELLPDANDPRTGIEEAELAALVQSWADRVYPTLEKTEVMLLWARANGVSFSDPHILKKTKLGKSVLHERFRAMVKRITSTLALELTNEIPSVRSELAIRLIIELGNRTPEKLFSGKPRLSLL